MNDEAACSAPFEQTRLDVTAAVTGSDLPPRRAASRNLVRPAMLRNSPTSVPVRTRVVKLVDQRCYDLAVLPLAAAEQRVTYRFPRARGS